LLKDALIECLVAAEKISVMTGAGVSAESGIATFRDRMDGLWAKYKPEDLATPEAFARDPATVWNWYQWRRSQLDSVEPNPAHFALAQLEQRSAHFTLVTQNVDRLHQIAGSEHVIELHGNIRESICHRTGMLIDSEHIERSGAQPPSSPHHQQGLARPNVVWFGEPLPSEALNAATAATRCDVFFSIGTSSVVQPAASLALMAKQQGACLVEINPQPTPLTPSADFVLQGPAGEVLPALLNKLPKVSSDH